MVDQTNNHNQAAIVYLWYRHRFCCWQRIEVYDMIKSNKQLTEDIERLERIVSELGKQLYIHENKHLEEGAHKF